MLRLTLLVVALAAGVSTLEQARGSAPTPAGEAPRTEGTYANPVLAGDYPDPSVIRVGRDYWATATTSQWAPIFPLLHSTDLVTWRVAGAVFQTPPAWSAGSYWAPEIAEDNGRFFVYYTARQKGGPLCVAVADAARPEGPYTDRGPLVCQEAGSIDAMPIRDENGRRFVVWKEDGNSRKLPTPLWAQPLSDDGTKLVGEKVEILRNQVPWEAHLVEGPFILRRGDWFYMFYSADSCCGRRCNYKLGVARSRKLLGPWERRAGDAILAGNEHWKCPGHGSIVDHPSGRTFLLYHAYHPSDFEYVGRQGLLDEVTWEADGWPAINGGRGPSTSAALPEGRAGPIATAAINDDFASRPLDPGWQWPWDQSTVPSIDPAADGWLRLGTSAAHTTVAAARATLAGTYVATTVLDVRSISAGARAGLAAFGNRDNVIAVTVEKPPQSAQGGAAGEEALTATVWQTQKGERKVLATERVGVDELVHLRLTATDRTRFQFAVSPDGGTWKRLGGDAVGEYLLPWDLSVRVALIVSGPPDASARFGAFKLEGARTAAR